jgi:hypothetical protein
MVRSNSTAWRFSPPVRLVTLVTLLFTYYLDISAPVEVSFFFFPLCTALIPSCFNPLAAGLPASPCQCRTDVLRHRCKRPLFLCRQAWPRLIAAVAEAFDGMQLR